jgi:2-C-methyl-D-erythritol 2,4-cyclodiphosphate synthase
VRIGIGYDVHRLTPGRPLILGGVRIEHERGLDGHSDADVLVHAIIDALLGAAALGDIGQHFPDTDPEWKGADSMKLLGGVVEVIGDAGYRVGNVDAVVVLQRPKLRPHIDAMRANIADVLGVAVGQVSVKATTGEKMGFAGREEGAAAHAVCLLEADSPGG